MLEITVQLSESFNEETSEFETERVTLELEHSLVSLSKWESEFEKPFLGKDEKTPDQVLAYIKHMIVTPTYPETVFEMLTQEHVDKITTYIDAKMTGTTFSQTSPDKSKNETITSELIYYWMCSCQIPWEAESWHLNRLFTLIRVFSVKNAPQKKRSRQEMAAERQALNAERMRKYQTTG